MPLFPGQPPRFLRPATPVSKGPEMATDAHWKALHNTMELNSLGCSSDPCPLNPIDLNVVQYLQQKWIMNHGNWGSSTLENIEKPPNIIKYLCSSLQSNTNLETGSDSSRNLSNCDFGSPCAGLRKGGYQVTVVYGHSSQFMGILRIPQYGYNPTILTMTHIYTYTNTYI